MKTKTITGKVEMLLVDVPKEQNDLLGHEHFVKNLPWGFKLTYGGNWEYLSTIAELTEEQAKGLVSIYDYPVKYTNYNGSMPFAFEKAIQSFNSLLEANGVLFENPHGDKPVKTDGYHQHLYNEDVWKWQQAEANVFNPKTTLIFIKK